MQVLFDRKSLVAALNSARAVHSTVVLRAAADLIQMVACNGRTELRISVAGRTETPGAVHVTIDDILPLLRKMVAFTFVQAALWDGKLHLTVSTAEAVLHVRDMDVALPWMCPHDAPWSPALTADLTQLQTAVPLALPFIAADETCYGLSGALFHEAQIAATDGSKLLVQPLKALVSNPFVVSRRDLQLLLAVSGKQRGVVAFETAETEKTTHWIRATLPDGSVLSTQQPFPARDFPNYASVIPKDAPKLTIDVDPAVLLTAIDRCGLFGQLSLETTETELLLRARRVDQGTIEERVPCTCSGTGLSRIGFDAGHLRAGVTAMGTARRIALRSVLGPVLLDVTDGVCIVMPIRLE